MSAERPTVAERAEADGWQRISTRLVEPGDRVRLHARSPEWTVLAADRLARGRDGRWRVTGYGDDGRWWDLSVARGAKIDARLVWP